MPKPVIIVLHCLIAFGQVWALAVLCQDAYYEATLNICFPNVVEYFSACLSGSNSVRGYSGINQILFCVYTIGLGFGLHVQLWRTGKV